MEKKEILPGAVYEAPEVAELLGLKRVDSVYAIPEDELVPTRVGPRRGKKVFMGSDVIEYLQRGRSKRAPRLSA